MSQEALHVVGTDIIGEADAPEENPGMDLLRAAGFSLNPSHLPNVRLDGENVVFSVNTDFHVSPEYKAAIEKLQSLGCTVVTDNQSQMHYAKLTITAPTSLFATATIDALSAINDAERIQAELREATRKNQPFDPGRTAEGELRIGC